MAAKLQEITAVYLREYRRFDDTAIVTCWCADEIDDEIAVKVVCDPDELRPEQEYRWLGVWHEHPKYGRQFHANSFVLKQPHTRQGVISYLRDAGEGLGFGIARAAKCWDIWGPDSVEHFRHQPLDVPSALAMAGRRFAISPQTAEVIAAKLNEDAALEGCTLDLLDVLTGRGFPRSAPRELIRRWGNRAAQVIRKDPYRMIGVVHGAGWKRCDALYAEFQLPPGKIKRQALAALYAVSRDVDGNTWVPTTVATTFVQREISGAAPQPDKAVKRAVRRKYLAELRTRTANGPISQDGNLRWVAEYRKGRNEGELAELIADAKGGANAWPDVRNLLPRCSSHQVEKLCTAVGAGAIAILGGGPGCGKTWTVAELVAALARLIGMDQVVIGAPTGKAAIRITETLANCGIPLRARTWHSILQGGDGNFFFNRDNPLPYKVFIGDEESMTDTDMMAARYRAFPRGALILHVGDVYQLAPAGHGAPLRDMIAAGVPYGELIELQRQAVGSMIAQNCKAIREGKKFIHTRVESHHRLADVITAARVDAGENQFHLEAGTPDQQMQRLAEFLRVCSLLGFDPIWQVQPLVMRNSSPVGRDAVNQLLLPTLNKTCNSPFRVGDKVICLKNGQLPIVESDDADPDVCADDKQQVRVANGETGRVVRVEDHLTFVQLEGPRRVVKVPRGKSAERADEDTGDAKAEDNQDKTTTGCSWDHAYGITVWKGQGTDWPATAMMIDDQAMRSGSRELIYTGDSRPKKLGVTIGKEAIMQAMCRRQAIWRRKTLLKERILAESAKRDLWYL